MSFPALTILKFYDFLPFLIQGVGHIRWFSWGQVSKWAGVCDSSCNQSKFSEVLLRDTLKGTDLPGLQSGKLPASRGHLRLLDWQSRTGPAAEISWKLWGNIRRHKSPVCLLSSLFPEAFWPSCVLVLFFKCYLLFYSVIYFILGIFGVFTAGCFILFSRGTMP